MSRVETKKSTKKFWMTLNWVEDNGMESGPVSYEFDTLVELVAFVQGVEEAAGSGDYEVVEQCVASNIYSRLKP
jgi:hypothetical protein